jgi:hypothetical protein
MRSGVQSTVGVGLILPGGGSLLEEEPRSLQSHSLRGLSGAMYSLVSPELACHPEEGAEDQSGDGDDDICGHLALL